MYTVFSVDATQRKEKGGGGETEKKTFLEKVCNTEGWRRYKGEEKKFWEEI